MGNNLSKIHGNAPSSTSTMIKRPELVRPGDRVRVNGTTHGPQDHARNPGDEGNVHYVAPICDTLVDGEATAIYVKFPDGRHEFFYGPELDLLS
jgi:hypothetical protein